MEIKIIAKEKIGKLMDKRPIYLVETDMPELTHLMKKYKNIKEDKKKELMMTDEIKIARRDICDIIGYNAKLYIAEDDYWAIYIIKVIMLPSELNRYSNLILKSEKFVQEERENVLINMSDEEYEEYLSLEFE